MSAFVHPKSSSFSWDQGERYWTQGKDEVYALAEKWANQIDAALHEKPDSFIGALSNYATSHLNSLLSNLSNQSLTLRQEVTDLLAAKGINLSQLQSEESNQTHEALIHTFTAGIGTWVNLAVGGISLFSPLGLLAPFAGGMAGTLAELAVKEGMLLFNGGPSLGFEDLKEIASRQMLGLSSNTVSGILTSGLLNRLIPGAGLGVNLLKNISHGAISLTGLETVKALLFSHEVLSQEETLKLIRDGMLGSVSSAFGLKGFLRLGADTLNQTLIALHNVYESAEGRGFNTADMIRAIGDQLAFMGHHITSEAHQAVGASAEQLARGVHEGGKLLANHLEQTGRFTREQLARLQQYATEHPEVINQLATGGAAAAAMLLTHIGNPELAMAATLPVVGMAVKTTPKSPPLGDRSDFTKNNKPGTILTEQTINGRPSVGRSVAVTIGTSPPTYGFLINPGHGDFIEYCPNNLSPLIIKTFRQHLIDSYRAAEKRTKLPPPLCIEGLNAKIIPLEVDTNGQTYCTFLDETKYPVTLFDPNTLAHELDDTHYVPITEEEWVFYTSQKGSDIVRVNNEKPTLFVLLVAMRDGTPNNVRLGILEPADAGQVRIGKTPEQKTGLVPKIRRHVMDGNKAPLTVREDPRAGCKWNLFPVSETGVPTLKQVGDSEITVVPFTREGLNTIHSEIQKNRREKGTLTVIEPVIGLLAPHSRLDIRYDPRVWPSKATPCLRTLHDLAATTLENTFSSLKISTNNTGQLTAILNDGHEQHTLTPSGNTFKAGKDTWVIKLFPENSPTEMRVYNENHGPESAEVFNLPKMQTVTAVTCELPPSIATKMVLDLKPHCPPLKVAIATSGSDTRVSLTDLPLLPPDKALQVIEIINKTVEKTEIPPVESSAPIRVEPEIKPVTETQPTEPSAPRPQLAHPNQGTEFFGFVRAARHPNPENTQQLIEQANGLLRTSTLTEVQRQYVLQAITVLRSIQNPQGFERPLSTNVTPKSAVGDARACFDLMHEETSGYAPHVADVYALCRFVLMPRPLRVKAAGAFTDNYRFDTIREAAVGSSAFGILQNPERVPWMGDAPEIAAIKIRRGLSNSSTQIREATVAYLMQITPDAFSAIMPHMGGAHQNLINALSRLRTHSPEAIERVVTMDGTSNAEIPPILHDLAQQLYIQQHSASPRTGAGTRTEVERINPTPEQRERWNNHFSTLSQVIDCFARGNPLTPEFTMTEVLNSPELAEMNQWILAQRLTPNDVANSEHRHELNVQSGNVVRFSRIIADYQMQRTLHEVPTDTALRVVEQRGIIEENSASSSNHLNEADLEVLARLFDTPVEQLQTQRALIAPENDTNNRLLTLYNFVLNRAEPSASISESPPPPDGILHSEKPDAHPADTTIENRPEESSSFPHLPPDEGWFPDDYFERSVSIQTVAERFEWFLQSEHQSGFSNWEAGDALRLCASNKEVQESYKMEEVRAVARDFIKEQTRLAELFNNTFGRPPLGHSTKDLYPDLTESRWYEVTKLREAVRHGNVEEVRQMIKKDPSLSSTFASTFPLDVGNLYCGNKLLWGDVSITTAENLRRALRLPSRRQLNDR